MESEIRKLKRGDVVAFKETYVLMNDVWEDMPVIHVIHGQWGPIINAYGELEGWICKRCGTESKQKSNYCPKCGAKMDLEG